MRIHWLILGICLFSIAGCRGCQVFNAKKDDQGKLNEADEAIPKQRLGISTLRALPASTDEAIFVKSGHWYELQQSAIANDADEALTVSCSTHERTLPFRPISILGLNEPITFERDISLARGQRKLLSLELFVPRPPALENDIDAFSKCAVRVAYQPRIIGPSLREEAYPVNNMPDHQYNLVVLSQDPDRYQFIAGMSCVVWPSDVKLDEDRISPYRVVQITQADVQHSLPNRLTTWTSISHVLWNDCSVSALSDKQQAALIDWLHFGGQLIIDGPQAQAALKNGFLSEYLPLKNVRLGKLELDRWNEFSKFWSVNRYGESDVQIIQVSPDREPLLIQGDLAAEARWVSDCNELVVERTVGSGRIVMTTFSLGESFMVHWPSYSSFFNAALLGRPPRTWQVKDLEAGGDMVFEGDMRGFERDPSYSSRFRLLNRDLGQAVPERNHFDHQAKALASTDLKRRSNQPVEDFFVEVTAPSSEIPNVIGNEESPPKFSMRSSDGKSRICFPSEAESSDARPRSQAVAQIEIDSGFARLAVAALRDASGIQVPRIKTIVQLLAGYFIVLVPLNWAFFRMLGRVEWAWMAAPIIALAGAVVVARSVQLDVGFTRSQVTLNLLDMKSGYPRGHLSSYVSLYTSLSTNYSARYPNNEGILLPLATTAHRIDSMRMNEASYQYEYAAEKGAGITSFPVRSNSTSFLRGEDVWNAVGSIRLHRDTSDSEVIHFQNTMPIEIREAGLVARSADGRWSQAWIGQIDKQKSGRVELEYVSNSSLSRAPLESMSVLFENWNVHDFPSKPRLDSQDSIGNENSNGELSLGMTLAKIVQLHPLGRGEVILLGWTDLPLAKLEVKPQASQSSERTLVVVRLENDLPTFVEPDSLLPAKAKIVQ